MTLKIGMVGTDTSHVVMFSQLLNQENHPFHIKGAVVTHAVRYLSLDFALSYSREPGFSAILKDELGIALVELDQLVEHVDAIMLVCADGRVHLPLFKTVVQWGKPIFIDKPLSIGMKDAEEIIQLAERYSVPIMSSSSLRFSTALMKQLKKIDMEKVKCITVKCPLHIEDTQSRYYWYGIHGVEILYSILGTGCLQVSLQIDSKNEKIVGLWENGILGEVQCTYDTDQHFEVLIETDDFTHTISLHEDEHEIPYYASLVEHVISFFNGQTYITSEEMLEVIWFIEQAESQYNLKRG